MTTIFSPNRQYRYVLRRYIGLGAGTCLFIMLNPSTADEVEDDPTIRRCKGFAIGYGELVVCNLFAFRATNPMQLYQVADPIGPDNDLHISQEATKAARVILAWGNHGLFLGRGDQIRRMLKQQGVHILHYGNLTQKGQPKHPLYLRRDAHLNSFGVPL